MRKFINILIFLLIFVLYFVTFLMIYDTFRERKLNSQEKNAVELFDKKIKKKKKEEERVYVVSYNGYTILGKLEIPKIGLSTVILKEQSYSAMNIAAVKSYGVDLNEKGGFVISGHNFRGRSVFFYNIKNLSNGNKVIITDNRAIRKEYTVYSVQRYVSPNDVSYLAKTDDYHVTLVTCENGGKSRIVVKAHVVE